VNLGRRAVQLRIGTQVAFRFAHTNGGGHLA
jgi:hypothetical protein